MSFTITQTLAEHKSLLIKNDCFTQLNKSREETSKWTNWFFKVQQKKITLHNNKVKDLRKNAVVNAAYQSALEKVKDKQKEMRPIQRKLTLLLKEEHVHKQNERMFNVKTNTYNFQIHYDQLVKQFSTLTI